MQLSPYLFFNGRCEEALKFYANVFGGEIIDINRFGDAPGGAMGDANPDHVMHSTFEAPGITFMASDGDEGGSAEMSRIALSIGSGDEEEGRRIFTELSEGGKVTMPYAKQFWGASFGSLTDKFGVRWLVNAGGG